MLAIPDDPARPHVGLELEAASDFMVVVEVATDAMKASLHVRFDFHTCLLLLDVDIKH